MQVSNNLPHHTQSENTIKSIPKAESVYFNPNLSTMKKSHSSWYLNDPHKKNKSFLNKAFQSIRAINKVPSYLLKDRYEVGLINYKQYNKLYKEELSLEIRQEFSLHEYINYINSYKTNQFGINDFIKCWLFYKNNKNFEIEYIVECYKICQEIPKIRGNICNLNQFIEYDQAYLKNNLFRTYMDILTYIKLGNLNITDDIIYECIKIYSAKSYNKDIIEFNQFVNFYHICNYKENFVDGIQIYLDRSYNAHVDFEMFMIYYSAFQNKVALNNFIDSYIKFYHSNVEFKIFMDYSSRFENYTELNHCIDSYFAIYQPYLELTTYIEYYTLYKKENITIALNSGTEVINVNNKKLDDLIQYILSNISAENILQAKNIIDYEINTIIYDTPTDLEIQISSDSNNRVLGGIKKIALKPIRIMGALRKIVLPNEAIKTDQAINDSLDQDFLVLDKIIASNDKIMKE